MELDFEDRSPLSTPLSGLKAPGLSPRVLAADIFGIRGGLKKIGDRLVVYPLP